MNLFLFEVMLPDFTRLGNAVKQSLLLLPPPLRVWLTTDNNVKVSLILQAAVQILHDAQPRLTENDWQTLFRQWEAAWQAFPHPAKTVQLALPAAAQDRLREIAQAASAQTPVTAIDPRFTPADFALHLAVIFASRQLKERIAGS
jgi:hypothetical protein